MRYPQGLVNIFWCIVLFIEFIFLMLIAYAFLKPNAPKKNIHLFILGIPLRVKVNVRNAVIVFFTILIFIASIYYLLWTENIDFYVPLEQ